MATLDIFTKYLIRKNNIQEYVVIEDILTIDLTYNTGIAFGLLSDYTIFTYISVSYTHLRAHETRHDLVCRLLLEKKK